MQSGQKPYNMTYYIIFFFIFRSIILLIYIVTSPPPPLPFKKKTPTKTNKKHPQNQLNKKKNLHIAVRMMRGKEYLLVSLYFNVDFV